MTKKEKINVCSDCENPLIWTFIYAGAEVYCPSCGASGDMFFGKTVEITPELILKYKKINKKFRTFSKHLFTGGARKKGCEKCNDGYHIHHMTEEETKKHHWAKEGLKKMKASN